MLYVSACKDPMIQIGSAVLVTEGYGKDFINTLGTRRTYTCSKGFTSPVPLTSDCEPSPSGPVWSALTGSCFGTCTSYHNHFEPDRDDKAQKSKLHVLVYANGSEKSRVGRSVKPFFFSITLGGNLRNHQRTPSMLIVTCYIKLYIEIDN